MGTIVDVKISEENTLGNHHANTGCRQDQATSNKDNRGDHGGKPLNMNSKDPSRHANDAVAGPRRPRQGEPPPPRNPPGAASAATGERSASTKASRRREAQRRGKN